MKMRRKLSLVIADDDPRDRELLRQALLRNGSNVEVHEVHDGEEVVEYLRGSGRFGDRQRYPFPDVLLLDLKMTRMSGLEVLDWLRKHPSCSHIPTVMFSGSGLDQDVEEAYRRGVNTYFAKPTEFGKFSRLVHLLIQYWEHSERPRIARQC